MLDNQDHAALCWSGVNRPRRRKARLRSSVPSPGETGLTGTNGSMPPDEETKHFFSCVALARPERCQEQQPFSDESGKWAQRRQVVIHKHGSLLCGNQRNAVRKVTQGCSPRSAEANRVINCPNLARCHPSDAPKFTGIARTGASVCDFRFFRFLEKSIH